MRALLVDMQTLMPVREVTCSLMHILQQQIQYFVFRILQHHVSGVVQAAQAEFTTGTPLFMGLNVICKQGQCISTELETLMYVLISHCLVLPWRHLDIDDHNHTSVKCGVMTSASEFFPKSVGMCWIACASCF